MYLYFINIIILGSLAVLDTFPLDSMGKKYFSKRALLVVGLGYLCFLSMFHGLAVGNDTYEYTVFFNKIASQGSLIQCIRASAFEPGYVLLNWLITRITDNAQILFSVTSLFCYISIGRFFGRHSKYPILSVYFFFTMMSFDFFLCALRQGIAIAVLLFAYDSLIERRFGRYMLWVLLAALFHNSALVFIPLYFVAKIRNNKSFINWAVVITIVLALGYRWIINSALSVFTRYQYYYNSSYFESGAKLSIALYFAVYICVLIAGEIIGKKQRDELTITDNLNFRFTAILPMICIVSFNAPVISRFLRYFQMFLYLYLPNELYKKDSTNKSLLVLFTVAAFAVYAFLIHTFRTPEWYTTYPFSFCWD